MTKYPLTLTPGLWSDDTKLAAKGRWVDGSNVRFWEGLPEIIGGWESLTSDLLSGVCRSVFQWGDNAGTLNIGMGTHSTLNVWAGGSLAAITPLLALPSAKLAASPLTTFIGTPTVVVSEPGNPHLVGETIIVSGAAAVGGITPNGTFVVTAETADTWTFVFSSNASSNAVGGGSAVVVASQRAFAAGAIDGTGGAGYGTGAWDVGTYGTPSLNEYFPRTWSLAAWGQQMLASPRGGSIYQWANVMGSPAVAVANAPKQVRAMVVHTNDQVFALGCNQEVSGLYNGLCIRHSSVRKLTEWNTNFDTTAREYILPGGGEIVTGRMIGQYLVVWTTAGMFLGTFTGNLEQPYRFDPIGKNCGLIGPNAVVVVGTRAVWLSPDLQFRSYTLGGQPTVVDCPIRRDMVDNIAPSQVDKIVASGVSKFNEARFDYPDARDGLENSRWLSVSLTTGDWQRGVMARTALVDAGPSADPIAITAGGTVYWQERGKSADGGPIAWFLETGELYMSEEVVTRLSSLWPDVSGQVGAWNLTLFSRLKPQGVMRTFGPVAIAANDDKVDIHFSGRLFRVRFSGESSPAAGRLGRPLFSMKTGSRR